MSRSLERKIIYTACIWQVLTGVITVFYYAFYVRSQGNIAGHSRPIDTAAIQSLFNNLYTFTVTYGLFFVVIGIINFIFTKRLVEDNSIQTKMPLLWIVAAIVFFILTDFISVALYLIAAVIAFSKNRSIKLIISKK